MVMIKTLPPKEIDSSEQTLILWVQAGSRSLNLWYKDSIFLFHLVCTDSLEQVDMGDLSCLYNLT